MNINNEVEELKKHCWVDENGDHQMPLDEAMAIITTLTEKHAAELEKVREETKEDIMKRLEYAVDYCCEIRNFDVRGIDWRQVVFDNHEPLTKEELTKTTK